jgi:hypothetical protein
MIDVVMTDSLSCQKESMRKKKLLTAGQYNQQRSKYYDDVQAAQRSHPNGVACPTCDEELWDTNPMVVLTSCPPQKNVHCPTCGYVGYLLY